MFSLICTELLYASLVWLRGVEWVNDELGNWLPYRGILWLPFPSTSLLPSSVLGWYREVACAEGDYTTAFLMAVRGDVRNAYCSATDSSCT